MSPWLVVGALGLVLGAGSRVQAWATTRGWIDPWVGRKTAHLGFGAALVASWPLFPEAPASRWIAALPAAVTGAYFVLVALGVVRDPGTVHAGSRTSTRAGMARGPLLYAVTVAAITVLFWRTSPVGVAALGVLVFGDGAAEIVGRTLRSPRLPWSPAKSVAGSLAAWVCGWAGGSAGVGYLVATGYLEGPLGGYLLPMAAVAFAGAAVESLPFAEIDNVTVPATCATVAYVLL